MLAVPWLVVFVSVTRPPPGAQRPMPVRVWRVMPDWFFCLGATQGPGVAISRALTRQSDGDSTLQLMCTSAHANKSIV